MISMTFNQNASDPDYTITLTNSDGTLPDLTGHTIQLSIIDPLTATIVGTMTEAGSTYGQVVKAVNVVTVKPTLLALLNYANYTCELWKTDGDPQLLDYGAFIVNRTR